MLDRNYVNHEEQYEIEKQYLPQCKNIDDYQKYLQEANPNYFETELSNILQFERLQPTQKRLDFDIKIATDNTYNFKTGEIYEDGRLIVQYLGDTNEYVELGLITKFSNKHPLLYRMKISDAIKFMTSYWYFYGIEWSHGVKLAAMTGNWKLPNFIPQILLNNYLKKALNIPTTELPNKEKDRDIFEIIEDFKTLCPESDFIHMFMTPVGTGEEVYKKLSKQKNIQIPKSIDVFEYNKNSIINDAIYVEPFGITIY